VLTGGELDLEVAAGLDDATLARFGLGGNPRVLLLECPYTGWPLDLRDFAFRLEMRGFSVGARASGAQSRRRRRP
jgi:hypothetical protein